MNGFRTTLAIALIAGAGLRAQELPDPKVIGDIVEQARIMAEDAKRQAAEMSGLDLSSLAHLKADLAMLAQEAPPAPKPPLVRAPIPSPYAGKNRTFVFSGSYDRGISDLDQRKYDDAIAVFDRIIEAKTDRSDGALYWKAYALNRLGRSNDALAAIATLRRDYAGSHWLGDAQVLEAEVKQNAGHPVSPADETNEDIKLMALNSLMNADPDRAMPLLENLLKSTSSIRLKERALFVLTQSKSPKAEQILTDYAKGAGNPDLQLRAIRYIGQSRSPESQQRLVTIYNSTTDATVKKEIIQALMASGANDKLLELGRSEKDPNLKNTIIQNLSVTRGTSAETLVSLYTAESDQRTKRTIIDGLHSRNDAKPLIEIARKESDPTMKKYIVEHLSTMRGNKDATDYMMELLK